MNPFMIAMGVKGVADYLGGRKSQQAQDRSDAANNARTMREYQAQMAVEAANMQALQERYNAEAAAGMRGVQGKEDAFNMLRDAESEEQEARTNLANALGKFGEVSKKARIESSKKKRSGSVAKAVKGAKGIKRAGAGRGGIRGALKGARTAGLQKAADTSSMAAALGAYGADLQDEFGQYNELAGKNMALGNFSKWTKETARERETLANQDRALGEKMADTQYRNALAGNALLGPKYLGPNLINKVDPNTGGLDMLSTLAGGYAQMYPYMSGGNKIPSVGDPQTGAYNDDGRRFY